MTRRSLAAAAIAALVAAAAPAAAQESSEPYIAKFKEGRALLQANRFLEALDKFEESLALKESSGTLLNIGDCQEHLGRYASALNSFNRARQLAADASQPEREKEAADRAIKIDPLVSKLTVKMAPGAQPVTIQLDGGPAQLGKPLPVDGGSHVVHAEANCKRPHDYQINVLMKADQPTVAVDPDSFDPDPACSTHKVVRDPGMSTMRLMSYVTGGVGIVAGGFGIAFGAVASSKKSDLTSACPTYPAHCAIAEKPALDAKYSDAHTAATLSTALVTGAIVLVAGGIVMYFISPEETRTRTGFVPGRFTF